MVEWEIVVCMATWGFEGLFAISIKASYPKTK